MRERILSIIVILLIFLSVMPYQASASQKVHYINKLPYTISESGYYILNISCTDLNGTAITIKASNVVLNGNNNTIDGIGCWGYGIHVSNVENITIENITIKQFDEGIHIFKSKKLIISRNSIMNNWACGIFLEKSPNSVISENNIANNEYYGIYLKYSSNSIVSENNIASSTTGIYLHKSSNNNIYGNLFVGCGLVVLDSYGNTVVENYVNERPLAYLEDESDITIDYPAGQIILVNCNNITIKNQNITNTTMGIGLQNTINAKIMRSNIVNNYYGIGLCSSLDNVISENNIASNKYGILIFESSSNNIISGNNVTNNYCGVCLQKSSNNKIYHNNFIDNRKQAVTYGSINVWDDGYPSGGNYWSDYAGSDDYHGPNQDQPGGDGIGDTPYVIDEDNVDRYPLMKPYVYKAVAKVSLHVSKPEVVPMNRFFELNVSISSNVDYTLNLIVVLVEHTGFQAGEEYGDGDEVYKISLPPRESRTVSFKAKVYGVPRIGEVASFKVYDEGGELLARKDVRLNLTLEFASVLAVVRPPWVEVGKSFRVAVPISYSFTRPTLARVVLECDGESVGSREVVLSGDGLEFFTFIVGSDLTAEPSTLNFTVRLSTFYPEEGMRVAPVYEEFESRIREFQVSVGIKAGNQSKSQLYPTGIFFTITLDGKTYYAMLMYNASAESPPPSGSIENYLRYRYSCLNWLVFEAGEKGLELVMDDELYQKLALIAEVAYSRWGIWNPHNIEAISSTYKELYSCATKAETVLILEKTVIKLIMLFKGSALESSIVEMMSDAVEVAGVYLKAKEILKYAQETEFAEILLEALKKTGGDVEQAVVWASIISLERAFTALEEANELLKDVKLGGYVEGEEVLDFLEKFVYGRSLGSVALKILGVRYSKWWLGFEEGIKAIAPVSTVIEVYKILQGLLGNESFKEFREYLGLIVSEMKYYGVWADVVKRKSLDFRNAFIQADLSDSVVVRLRERGRKLYLYVYDVEGRSVRFDVRTGLVEVDIPGAQYFDFGSEILVVLPADVNISRVVIDACMAEEPRENYTLEVKLFRDGEAVREKSISGSIQRGINISYKVSVSEAEVSVKSEYIETTKPKSAKPTIPIEYIAIITIVVVALIVTVAIKRKRR